MLPAQAASTKKQKLSEESKRKLRTHYMPYMNELKLMLRLDTKLVRIPDDTDEFMEFFYNS